MLNDFSFRLGTVNKGYRVVMNGYDISVEYALNVLGLLVKAERNRLNVLGLFNYEFRARFNQLKLCSVAPEHADTFKHIRLCTVNVKALVACHYRFVCGNAELLKAATYNACLWLAVCLERNAADNVEKSFNAEFFKQGFNIILRL